MDYDYDAIGRALNRQVIRQRPGNMWRYRELLPLEGEPTVGIDVGFTPLVRARNLQRALKHTEVYVKNDAVSYPTLSFKDRVVSVALSKAKEFGFDTVACATTGNLGNSLAAQSVLAGLRCFIFMPANLEQGKIVGTAVYGVHVVRISGNYDSVNRLCTEIADRHNWAFVKINIRPYYAEGSKTFGFEILEQLGWRAPRHIVVPMAGGSLITKVEKAIREFTSIGLIEAASTKIHGAQETGCHPIAAAVKADETMLGRGRHRRGDRRGHQAAGRNRGYLYRDGRGRDAGGDQETHRAGAHPAGGVRCPQHHRQRSENTGSGSHRAAGTRGDRGQTLDIRRPPV